MLGKIIVGAILCCSLAAAEQVTIPLGQSFLNTPIFDEVDVSLESAGSSFIEITPLVLEGLGTDDWSSIFLTEQHASSSGPAAAGLTAIALNLTAKTDPIKIVVRLRFQGGAIRALECFFDGTEWTVTELSLNGSGPGGPNGGPAGLNFGDDDPGGFGDGLNGPGGGDGPGDADGGPGGPGGPGDGPSGPGGPDGPGGSDPGDGPGDGNRGMDPQGPSELAAIPEPSLTGVAGLALVALVIAIRRRNSGLPRA
jgi:hypothetical protein